MRQIADAQMSARRRARDTIRSVLGGNTLHGADLQVSEHELGEGDREVTCLLTGNAVQRVREVAPVELPAPTVRLA